MDGDLISRKALLEKLDEREKLVRKLTANVDDEAEMIVTLSAVRKFVNNRPDVDAVPRAEYEGLLKRFRHLLESDFIASFAEVEPFTGKYKRDIAEADKVQPVRHSKWVCRTPGMFSCNACGNLAVENQSMYYCPECGAKMDGETKDDG